MASSKLAVQLRNIGVSMKPGRILFARMPNSPYSAATDFVSTSTPVFVAPQMPICEQATGPAVEETVTIVPSPASFMTGIEYFMPSHVPRRFTSISRSNASW
jgi:hypothetical protein